MYPNFSQRPLLVAVVLLLGSASAHDSTARIIETILGTGARVNDANDGPAIQANIGDPFGVEIGPDGMLYVTEVAFHRIRRLDPKTGVVITVAGIGTHGYTGDGGPATDAALNEPYEVRFDAEGNMYFVEMRNHVVRRVDSRTGVIRTIAGTGKPGFGGDGGLATLAQLNVPHSIAIDGVGRLFIADIGNHRIRSLDLKTGRIETIAGTGERRLPKSGIAAKGQPMLGPRALYVEKRGLWIALREGNSVWRLDLETGIIEHIAGTGQRGYSGDGGPAPDARFNGPKGIAVGPNGDVFVADTENHVIRKIDRVGGIVTTVAGRGPDSGGFGGDAGPPLDARLNRPHGICVDRSGALYIGDTSNHRVRRVMP
jgi:streptogramin lyase